MHQFKATQIHPSDNLHQERASAGKGIHYKEDHEQAELFFGRTK